MEVFFQNYRGTDRGFGVTIPDLLFIGIALYLIIKRPFRIKWWPYNTTLWIVMILISIASLANAGVPIYGWFTIHKFVRCLILYWVIVNVIRSREDILVIVKAMILALLWQGIVVMWAKYVTGSVVVRSIGSFNHPNAMAMYLNLILPIVWACLLEGVLPKRWRITAIIGLGLSFMAVLFTKSRAAIVLMPTMMLGVTFLSAIRKVTIRKVGIIGIAMVCGLAVFGIALPRIIERFEKAPKESAQTRVHFNDAADAMGNDRLLGCGINQFSWALQYTDYYWIVYSDKVDLADPEAFRETTAGLSRLGTAHHIYYLFLAETGWPGLIVFILFIARFYIKTLIGFFRAHEPLCRAVLTGMVGGFALLHLHGTLEWVLRQTQTLYLFFILNGLMIATIRIDRSLNANEQD